LHRGEGGNDIVSPLQDYLGVEKPKKKEDKSGIRKKAPAAILKTNDARGKKRAGYLLSLGEPSADRRGGGKKDVQNQAKQSS